MLLTNGCSFVWGDELDGYDHNPPNHQEHTFTHKLAKLLGGIPYENLARCGNGNDKIFRDTIIRLNETDKPKPTHIVILWSAWQREEYANRIDRKAYNKSKAGIEDCMIQFSEERTVYTDQRHWGTINKYYNQFYDVRTSIIQQLNYMLAIQKLCESMDIKLIQGAFHQRMMINLSLVLNSKEKQWGDYLLRVNHQLSLLKDTSKIGLGKWIDMFSLAKNTEEFEIKPYDHPCEKTHHEYAKLLHHIFTKYVE